MIKPTSVKPAIKKEQPDKFELQFKKIIKDIVDEEKYFKEENIKDLMKRIIEQLDPLIAKHVKQHFKALALLAVEVSNETKKSEPINGDKIDA